MYFADHWEAYAELIPKDLLVQTKAEMHGVGRDNFRQRHWFARFRRKPELFLVRCKWLI